MIISPPLLKTAQGNHSDEDWLKDLMPFEAKGNYPISSLLAWHGGQHIKHNDTGTRGEPVRAIADGIVIYARPSSPLTGEKAKPDLAINGGSNDGCVIIKHKTEIGEGPDGNVEYYSIYMHLKQVFVQKNQPVYRKAELGSVGLCNGDNAMHMEIICDDPNLKKLVGREKGNLDLSKDGRMDVVYGDIHFYLPVGATFYGAQPSANSQTGTGTPAYTSVAPLFISMRFEKGNCKMSTREENPEILGEYVCVGNEIIETDYEYNLYKSATTLANQNQLAPSAIYELLRFGRVININNETVILAGAAPHWRKVNFPGGQGWVNLNAVGVTKYSDADFPQWMGWNLIADDATPDSQCNSPTLLAWLDSDGDEKYTSRELVQAVGQDKIKERLSRAICKFPTEWALATLNTRYEWIKTKSDLLEVPLDPAQYDNLIKLATALCFWAEADLGIADEHWHFHPREFIGHFRKCGWLSADELERIYQPLAVGSTNDQDKILAYKKIINHNVSELNRMTRKYGLNTKKRLPHILGQGAIESTYMKEMQESAMPGTAVNGAVRPPRGSRIMQQSKVNESQLGHWWGREAGERVDWFGSTKYNSSGGYIASSYNWRGGSLGDPDAQKFRGRGFKQLTGRTNYVQYWVYRSWLSTSSFDDYWWDDPQYLAHNEAGMRRRAGIVNNPEVVTAIPYNCMDSGGWYMTFQRPAVNKKMDSDFKFLASSAQDIQREQLISKAVTYAINGGYIDWEGRLKATRAAKSILLDF
ncbi:M23 family metallopeptidase [Iodobacter fluviatilis]|uniref:Hydroxyethylthiazole kinase n=1 Tax=Iodobacter fluviatilis TaxID=537 RepID=A0A377Q9W6_9NEIS|nr:M23 family metallopeptidase [Iodobacter fluviatilis]TCU81249.1 hydroxyethylthiazole kinase [Iodobacter fluviatilis]STQ91713.1 Predicted chitinase [Iodobacter fluviatilis]